jgi:hypothetical protein
MGRDAEEPEVEIGASLGAETRGRKGEGWGSKRVGGGAGPAPGGEWAGG